MEIEICVQLLQYLVQRQWYEVVQFIYAIVCDIYKL